MKKYLLLMLCWLSYPLAATDWQLEPNYQVFAGEPVSLQNYIGKQPVYLKLWASWCRECRQELPNLQSTYEQYQGKLAMFAVNINISETETNIRRLYDQHKLIIPIVLDHNGSIASHFEFSGTPFHVLINRQGDVVYTTYKDDAQLAQNLALLAADKLTAAEPVSTKNPTTQPVDNTAATELLYFSATWCDWYMKDMQPAMAENCQNAVKAVADVQQRYPAVPLQGFVTHLWTEATDVTEYQQKFAITYPVTLDKDNARMQQYQVSGFPTLIVLKEGKEVMRLTSFKNAASTLEQLKPYL